MSVKHCESYELSSFHRGTNNKNNNKKYLYTEIQKIQNNILVLRANLCACAYAYITSGWFLLQQGSFLPRLTWYAVALKHNYFYVQSTWKNVMNVLHSTEMFLSPGTDVDFDRPEGSLIVKDGMVKNHAGWRELTVLQSYDHSSSV